MLLLIALGLALAYSALKPLSDGLLDTSLWVAKILLPPDAEENATTKQLLKMSQAALMEGWLSNVPFVTTIVFFSCLIIAFFYRWWAPIVMFFASTALGTLTKILWARSVGYYLPLLYHKMVNRAADYRTKNDLARLEASESYCQDLQEIILLYQGAGLRPPSPKQLKEVPYGDIYYWLDRGNGRA